jgi:hypothetical protein
MFQIISLNRALGCYLTSVWVQISLAAPAAVHDGQRVVFPWRISSFKKKTKTKTFFLYGLIVLWKSDIKRNYFLDDDNV